MRIAEFTVDVPLAAIDDDSQLSLMSGLENSYDPSDLQAVFGLLESIDNVNVNNNNNIGNSNLQPSAQNLMKNGIIQKQTEQNSSPDSDTFSETLGGSLEDLVSHFDEKISHCFNRKNLTEETDIIAPVQIRSQDEIMNESQIWWTLTGNFGNILPIDWSKSYARKLQLPALRLRPKDPNIEDSSSSNDLDVSDDEELAQALDLHSLIASQFSLPEAPPQTADEVIEEIDEIMMQESFTSEWTACSDLTTGSCDSLSYSLSKFHLDRSISLIGQNARFLEDRVQEATAVASCEENLWSLSYKDLVSLHSEMETLIKIYNETLVQELAARDEIEEEKEMKNTFISLLLNIQDKRRQWNMERKRKTSEEKTVPTTFLHGEKLPQFMTTIIPYDDESGLLDNSMLERLIKILRAVNDDNPNVPNMLTDYILNVICPTTTTSLSLW